MRDDLTDYALRITPVADSPDAGFANLQQPAIILFPKQSPRAIARHITNENGTQKHLMLTDFRRLF